MRRRCVRVGVRGFRRTPLFRYNRWLVWLSPHIQWASVGNLRTGRRRNRGVRSMKHAFWLATTAIAAIALAASGAALAEEQAAKPDPAKAKQIVDTICAACHGADGNSPI